MERVTSVALDAFFRRLGESTASPAAIYLLGGSALCLLGSPRETLDIDYTFESQAEISQSFQQVLEQLGDEMQLDLEPVPLGEFIPLPPGAFERRRLVGRYGNLDVYIFDLYSIALSKISRGFEADIDDVLFLLKLGLIQFGELERLFELVLPRAWSADIDPKEFKAYFEEVRRQAAPGVTGGGL